MRFLIYANPPLDTRACRRWWYALIYTVRARIGVKTNTGTMRVCLQGRTGHIFRRVAMEYFRVCTTLFELSLKRNMFNQTRLSIYYV